MFCAVLITGSQIVCGSGGEDGSYCVLTVVVVVLVVVVVVMSRVSVWYVLVAYESGNE